MKVPAKLNMYQMSRIGQFKQTNDDHDFSTVKNVTIYNLSKTFHVTE